MDDVRSREIAQWTLDLPVGWFTVPTGDLDPHTQAQWIDEVIEQTRDAASEPGSPSALRQELARVRADVVAQGDPWLSAAVSIRPETIMTVGCVLLTSVIGLDSGDDADAFAALLEEGFGRPGRGVRSHSWRVWRDEAEAGELVGGFQRFEAVDPGAGIGTVEDRTIFGLFPSGASEMIRMEFRVSDLGTYDDMPAQTAVIARSARVVLEEPA